MIISNYQIDKTKYFNIKELIKHYKEFNKFVVISDNGIGKTYSVENLVCEYIKQGKKCVWMRNTDLEAIKTIQGLKEACDRNFKKIEIEGIGQTPEYIVTAEGIMKICEWTKLGTPKRANCVCPLIYLSSLSRSVPQGVRASLIVLDEFIDGNEKNKFIMNNYNSQLKKAINRLTRPIKGNLPLFIALANPHQPQHDLIYSLGLDFDWDKLANMETDYQYNLKRGVVGLVIPEQFKIEEMKKTYTYWEGEEGKIENYTFLSNKYKQVLVNIDDKLINWTQRIKFNGYYFGVGEICVNNENHMYIKEITPNFREDIDMLAVTPTDASKFAKYYISNEIRAVKLSYILNSLSSGMWYAGSDFTFETIKKMLSLIVLLERNNLNINI